ncbi:SDR family oxidoreductase [Pedobacter miscanthi]|uniref:NmrA family transcriptional regulator n=1 Tax=Pedobacter miscanthi TaxID=2259170 RepID=A0A366KZT2_9SPHI|nr:SDR family oxidoreductase [Pedobacter miscanthi]RBQ06749.1 NmrA family transcriptional regulator [Pedobacter miscanthi]
MKIVVIGGSGLIGSKLVASLEKLGHGVIVGAPQTGVNTITGEGLKEALKGADVVVDVANSPSFEDNAVMDFFQTSGKNLLAAEAEAGVKHHVALSVVGTERLQGSGYFRAKLAQEKLIKESGIPYSILHSTQFFEFVGGIIQSGTVGDTIHVSPAMIQPISSDDVVAAMTAITIGSPINTTVEVAGPEKIGLSELVKKYMGLKGDTRTLIADSHTPYFGVEINDSSLTPAENARIGSVRYDDWIALPGNLR